MKTENEIKELLTAVERELAKAVKQGFNIAYWQGMRDGVKQVMEDKNDGEREEVQADS